MSIIVLEDITPAPEPGRLFGRFFYHLRIDLVQRHHLWFQSCAGHRHVSLHRAFLNDAGDAIVHGGLFKRCNIGPASCLTNLGVRQGQIKDPLAWYDDGGGCAWG